MRKFLFAVGAVLAAIGLAFALASFAMHRRGAAELGGIVVSGAVFCWLACAYLLGLL